MIFARHKGPYIAKSTQVKATGAWEGSQMFKAGAFSFFMKRAQMEGAEASPGGAMWPLWVWRWEIWEECKGPLGCPAISWVCKVLQFEDVFLEVIWQAPSAPLPGFPFGLGSSSQMSKCSEFA